MSFLQLKLSHPKAEEGASEEEEVAVMGRAKADVLWQMVSTTSHGKKEIVRVQRMGWLACGRGGGGQAAAGVKEVKKMENRPDAIR